MCLGVEHIIVKTYNIRSRKEQIEVLQCFRQPEALYSKISITKDTIALYLPPYSLLVAKPSPPELRLGQPHAFRAQS